MEIAIWADGTWCEVEEVHEFTHKSDDYRVVTVPEDVDCIDTWVAETRPQDG